MRVLVVDDHKNTCITLGGILRREGHTVSTASSGAEAKQSLANESFDAVITDLKLGDMDGIEVLSEAKSRSPRTEVVVITAFGSIASAVKAMKLGAYDYIAKPLRRDDIRSLINDMIARRDLPAGTPRMLSAGDQTTPEIIGNTAAIREVGRLIRDVAPTDVPVLITGESGTGKELVARAIHALSNRRDKPFLAINCGALPEHLQESELFGHARGAFTGAVEQKEGLFVEAKEGTILLDEVGEMTGPTQVKLLRVLQDGEVRPVGSTHPLHVSTRVLASTNQPILDLVEHNRFRRDLYFRINVVHIALPPLRERLDDLPLFVDHFLGKFSERYQKSIAGVTPGALAILRRHDWPGNIRELENVLKRAVILCGGSMIDAEDLDYLLTDQTAGSPGKRLVQQERDLILQALNRNAWNQKQTASELGIGVTTLWRKIKKFELTKQQRPPS